MPGHFTKKSSSVILTSAIEKKADAIADAFFAQTKKNIVITDGVRTAADQAVQVLAKIKANDLSIYLNQKAAQEIKRAHDVAVAAKKPQAEVLKAMTAVIEDQIKRKVFISKHLTGRAFDVRNRDMTAKQKQTFKQVVQHTGGVSMIEEGKPPHFHLQLA
jgi:predicted nucleotide-binding protein